MPLTFPHAGTTVFGVKDAAIYKITADVAGSATAYASKIDVPGIKEVIVTETWKESFGRGDNTLLAFESMRDTVRVVVKHLKLSLDAVAVITGSTVADSGTTPAQKVVNTYAATDYPNYFKIEAQCVSVDGVGGDGHIVLGKVKIAGARSFGLVEEGFEEYQFEVVAVPPLGTGSVWYSETFNETAIAIS